MQLWQAQKKQFEWREIQLASNDDVSAVVRPGLKPTNRFGQNRR